MDRRERKGRMMREILFKAKRIDNGEWVEGYYVYEHSKKTHCILQNELSTCLNVGSKPDFRDYILEPYEVNHDTLCQYTGLIDKNGQKIWENDILECGMRLRVSWHHFKASWVLSKKGWMYNHFFGESVEPEDVEVIGNIFDNPELLDVEREK